MLASTPTADFVAVRQRTRDHSMSPTLRCLGTPPRRVSENHYPVYDSPMLTPSPLSRRQSPLLTQPNFGVPMDEQDDFFAHSPMYSPVSARSKGERRRQSSYTREDVQKNLFPTSASFAHASHLYTPSPGSPTLRTPAKRSVSLLTTNAAQGTKRKSTPLAISTSPNVNGSPSFDRLAPLPPPRFAARTPGDSAEADKHLGRHAESMTRLRISEADDSGDDFQAGDDSGCDLSYMGSHSKVSKAADDSLGRRLGAQLLIAAKKSSGKDHDEVVEAVSPGGHITKRRAKSRPVSVELLESVNRSPSPTTTSRVDTRPRRKANVKPIMFPKGHRRNASGSSDDSRGHSRHRARSPQLMPPPPPMKTPPERSIETEARPGGRAPLACFVSSATLFFGPAIEQPKNSIEQPQAVRPRTDGTMGASRPTSPSRHSYAGSSASKAEHSPRSSPVLPGTLSDSACGIDDDEEVFFNGSGQGHREASFVFNVTANTPSPRTKAKNRLSRKFKARDSGVVMSDDDEDDLRRSPGISSADSFLNVSVGPRTSVSAGSVSSDGSEALITPGVYPGPTSGWPAPMVVTDYDAQTAPHGDVDAFIARTLAAGGRADENKRVPGTPVKRAKVNRNAATRPWQSAVATKIGDFAFGIDVAAKKKPPRKSLPAFLSKDAGSDTEEDEEDSPSTRKEGRYGTLGLGRPQPAGPTPRNWLMRRSSSGIFSSGSDTSVSAAGTPTHLRGKGPSIVDAKIKFTPGARTASGSSTSSSVTTLNSPSGLRHLGTNFRNATPIRPRKSSAPEPSSEEHRAGRFERDFIEVDEVGSGEFGQVMKVRYRDGREDELYAVKKSKRFEGVRHRLRLQEEVTILKHLTARGPHLNVLEYVDSWEQENALYIQTELCANGNFARFLWEYGRTYPRLDEARVWKILADISSGLDFIHSSGVIHLDIKPANIFIAGEGRFKIGDFGLASLWPRPQQDENFGPTSFEREGDKNYLAPEVLQGHYGKAADVFSFGMTMLETAANIVVPDQGEPWHRLRQEDFDQIDLDESPELFELIKSTMRTDPSHRIDMATVCAHPTVARARAAMERARSAAFSDGTSLFAASPLSGAPAGFLEEILGHAPEGADRMDLGP